MSAASEIQRIKTAVADAYTSVNEKGGTLPASQTVANLAAAVDSISTGATTTPLSVAANGTYTAPTGQAYTPVTVNVPTPSPTIQALSVTENGTYTAPSGTDGYSPVTVNVQPSLETLAATANGTYTPSSGKDGFSQVSVNVPTTEAVLTNPTVFETTDATGDSTTVQCVPGITTMTLALRRTYVPDSAKATFVGLRIGSTVTTLDTSCFNGCSAIAGVVRAPAVTLVSTNAFYGCSNIEEIHLPAFTQFSGNQMFSYCTNLKVLDLSAFTDGYWAYYAMNNCPNLEDIYLGGVGRNIVSNAFLNSFTNVSEVRIHLTSQTSAHVSSSWYNSLMTWSWAQTKAKIYCSDGYLQYIDGSWQLVSEE